MTSTLETKTECSPEELRDTAGDLLLLDVRTPAEFRERHIKGSILQPITRLDPQKVKDLVSDKAGCVVVCASGNRASMAASKLRGAGLHAVTVLAGGVQAWEAANLPLVRGESTVSLERQVRIAAGTLVAIGCVLAYFVSPVWITLPGFVGCGFVFAGITDTCTLGLLVAQMPWNR